MCLAHLLVARLMKRHIDITQLLYSYTVDRKHVCRLYVILLPRTVYVKYLRNTSPQGVSFDGL